MFFRFRRPRPSTIRPLRIDAAEACAAIHRSGFAHPWSARGIRDADRQPHDARQRSARPGDRPVARFRACRRRSAWPSAEAEVLTIAVDPALRGRGVGADLLREHLARATLSGARAIFLEVDPDNVAAIALYRRFGFRDVGRREGYYRLKDGQSASALVMRKDLA